MIRFKAPLVKVGNRTILRLPQDVSNKLPSRGMVMLQGTINGHQFQAPVEPDGKHGHWLNMEEELSGTDNVQASHTVDMAIEVSKEWPEPNVPDDLLAALKANARAYETWQDITPMARWDWIRWVRSTKNPDTRKRRVEVTCSKLSSAKRRPCCFNRTECTDPSVSRGGILLDAAM